ncbi:protein FAM104A isoform X1 [Perca fluviatilis]|uniref:protein FAM104A isoform X1 n=1 Tax=Perca fluviatilis TaxID=8168 RepID=UPI00196294E1|nr:protein FAM104A isoform X1 [Perca fluviatilis]
MLTENRKRQRSGGDEESGHLVPQAKRQSRAHPLSPEPGRDAWDSEVQTAVRRNNSNTEETSSNSESSSSISSPEHAAGSCSSQCVVGPCSPLSSGDSPDLARPTNLVSYLQINRILKHAHFQSLQSRCQLRDT